MANDFVASFRLNRLRSEGDTAHAASNIFKQVAINALTDDMPQAEVADMVTRRTQADRIQEVAIAIDFDGILRLLDKID